MINLVISYEVLKLLFYFFMLNGMNDYNFVVKDRSDLSKSLDADTSKSKKGQKSGTQSAVKFDDGPQEGEGEEEAASPTALAMLDRLSQYVAKW